MAGTPTTQALCRRATGLYFRVPRRPTLARYLDAFTTPALQEVALTGDSLSYQGQTLNVEATLSG